MRRLGRFLATVAVVATLSTAATAVPAHAGAGRWADRHSMYQATNGSRCSHSNAQVPTSGRNDVIQPVAP
jgi:hypothetical protein